MTPCYITILCFHLDTFCFEERSYSVREDDGSVNMTLTLSKALPFNISVKFVYTDLTARGKLVMYYVICTT